VTARRKPLPGQVPTRTARAILPVGLQIAGAPRSEALILDGAKVLENIPGPAGTTPIDPRA
jgi:Asp-tRNA(Asn)/Glu-tRNA(Gln) amidotransferase A subunit family amidase